MLNISLISSGRSDFGIMKNLCVKLNDHILINFKLIITGSHFDKQLGYSISEINSLKKIKKDKIKIDVKSNSKKSTIKFMSESMLKLFDKLNSSKPDFLIVLGDRFEIFAITQSAYLLGIPIIHFHGGEVTNNVIDEAFRHSITKMSTYHFVSTEIYKKRVIQLGENPNNVFNVGSLSLENIKDELNLSKINLEKKLDIKFLKKNILLTYHTETKNIKESIKNFEKLLKILISIKHTLFIITYPNNDPGYKEIIKIIKKYEKLTDNIKVFKSLGRKLYLNTLKFCDCIIGNSSSGIIEAPTLGIYTINIGKRQDGRVKSKSIIDTTVNKKNIVKILNDIFKDFLNIKSNKNININPYEKNNTSDIVIKKILKFKKTTNKNFYDL